jgi:Fe-S oxidoreductase
MSDRKPADQRDNQAPPSAIDTYFRNIIVLNQAFTAEGQPFRDSRAQPRAGAAGERATLWLGCNILRTPHLAQLATSVVRLLNPELSILGGPSHCCGSPMPEQSERERALARTIGHFQAEGAPTLISWCPSCHTNLRKGSEASSWGFDELHVTEFIARHLDRLKLEPRLSARVMLHGHTGTPDRDRDMENCRKLLTAIPGVTIVAEHADPDLGLHCVPVLLAPQIGLARFESKVQALLASARAAGAEMLVTIYHSCYREIEKRLRANTPVIENYITLLARALDLPVPANVYREIAHGAGARIEELRCAAEARGVDRAEFERAVKAEFPPAAAKPSAVARRPN